MRGGVFEYTSFNWRVVVVNGKEACSGADVVPFLPFKVW